MLSLKELTAWYDKPMTESMVRLYTAVLLDLTQEEMVLVFSRSRDRVQVLSKPASPANSAADRQLVIHRG